MRQPLLALAAAASAALSSACYRVTVVSGAPIVPATTPEVEVPWASGWVYGLVAPPPVSAAGKCPQGVARVVTQQSFVNLLAETVTLGIYTPMTITANCANLRGRGAAAPRADTSAVARRVGRR